MKIDITEFIREYFDSKFSIFKISDKVYIKIGSDINFKESQDFRIFYEDEKIFIDDELTTIGKDKTYISFGYHDGYHDYGIFLNKEY